MLVYPGLAVESRELVTDDGNVYGLLLLMVLCLLLAICLYLVLAGLGFSIWSLPLDSMCCGMSTGRLTALAV